MAGQNNLSPVYNKSFPSMNLFEVSLVRDNDPNLPFYKSKYFCFLSLAPGGQSQQGNGRTYNKEGKITIKADFEKVLALAESIRFWARGFGQQMGKFSIFVDSSKSSYGQGQGTFKSIFVSDFIPKNKQTNEAEAANRQISISFMVGNNKPIGNFYTPSEALAIADILTFIGKKAMEEDYTSRSVQVGTVNQVPQQNNYSRQQAPTQQHNNTPPVQQYNNTPPVQQNNAPPFDDSPPNYNNNAQNVATNFSDTMNNMATGVPLNNTPPPFVNPDVPFA